VAFDVLSPLGVSWGTVVLGLVVTMVICAAAATAMAARSVVSRRLSAVMLLAIVAGAWTSFAVTSLTTYPAPFDDDGTTCLADFFSPDDPVDITWDSECGDALKLQLALASVPSLLVLAGSLGIVVVGLRRVRRGDSTSMAAHPR
jgi:hypothetical protein